MSLSEYSLKGKEFLTYVVFEKSTWYVVKFRAQKLAIVFQNKSLGCSTKSRTYSNDSEGEKFFEYEKESREECHCPSTVWGSREEKLWPRWCTYVVKKVLDTLSNFALKTRYLMIQHKSLFNLVKDLFKWIEGLERSVTVRLESEGEKFFDLGCIRKKYLIRCQISRSKLDI